MAISPALSMAVVLNVTAVNSVPWVLTTLAAREPSCEDMALHPCGDRAGEVVTFLVKVESSCCSTGFVIGWMHIAREDR